MKPITISWDDPDDAEMVAKLLLDASIGTGGRVHAVYWEPAKAIYDQIGRSRVGAKEPEREHE